MHKCSAFEYLPRSGERLRGKEVKFWSILLYKLLAFSVSISAINRRGFSCNTLQLGVDWVGEYLGDHLCLFVKAMGHGVLVLLCHGRRCHRNWLVVVEFVAKQVHYGGAEVPSC